MRHTGFFRRRGDGVDAFLMTPEAARNMGVWPEWALTLEASGVIARETKRGKVKAHVTLSPGRTASVEIADWIIRDRFTGALSIETHEIFQTMFVRIA